MLIAPTCRCGRVVERHLLGHLAAPVVCRVRRRPELVERPQARVRDDRGEPVRVAGHPVRHVPAERPTHRGRAGLVDVVPRLRRVGDREQVGVGRPTPGAPAVLDELLAVARGECGVRQQHRVPARDEDPRVPAPRPRVPRPERTAVDPQDQRRLGVRRLGEPRADSPAVRRRLDLLERAGELGCRDRADQRRARLRRVRRQIDPDGVRRCVVGGPQRVRGPAVRADADVGERRVVAGDSPARARGEVDAEDRTAAVVVGRDQHALRVRQPDDAVRPAVPLVGQDPRLAPVERDHRQAHHRRLERRRQRLARVRDPATVRRDHRTPEVGPRIVDENRALARRDVDPDQAAALRARGLRHRPSADDRRPVGADRRLLLDQVASGVRRDVRERQARVCCAGQRLRDGSPARP